MSLALVAACPTWQLLKKTKVFFACSGSSRGSSHPLLQLVIGVEVVVARARGARSASGGRRRGGTEKRGLYSAAVTGSAARRPFA